MTLNLQPEIDEPQASSEPNIPLKADPDKILCPHCQRTATNGIKCKGICVADSDY